MRRTTLLLLLSAPAAWAQVLPEPPQVLLNTCLPVTTNTITVCSSGCDYTNPQLQTAIDNAPPGTTILLQSGHNYVGPFTLPAKSGDAWIIIRTNIADAQLPDEDHRIDPSYAPVLAKLQAPVNQSALVFASGAHHYRVMDLEVRTVGYSFDIIVAGSTETAVANVPHDLVFDRLYIHGDAVLGTKRGIRLNSASSAVINCWISDCKANGQDAQAIAGWNGPGPFKIVNNHLEGSGENVMFGGALATITDLVPSDIEIRNNHFFKPLSWRIGDPNYEGTPWCIKNLFELKNAQRVWVEGNIFENNWAHCQSGFAIVFTPRTESGAAMNNRVTDVTWRHNQLINSDGGFNISGHDDQLPNPVSTRILIEHNLSYTISSVNKMYQFLNGAEHVTIRHNTDLNSGTTTSAAGAPMVALTFANNIVGYGGYGVCGTGSGCGNATINTYFPGSTFTHNVIVGTAGGASGNANQYPPFHWFPAQPSAVGFTDIATNNYHLLPSSTYTNAATDGTDIGADIDSVDAHTSEVRTGYWPNCADISTGANAFSVASVAFSVFPNPTADQFTIKPSRSVPGGQVRITNALGAVVMTGTLSAQGTTIDLGALPAQNYVLQVFDALGVELGSQRVVVLKRD